jgi:hypothetical protein
MSKRYAHTIVVTMGALALSAIAAAGGAIAQQQPNSDKPSAHADQSQPIYGNGIAIDEQGYLWIADGAGYQLLRLQPPGELIVERYGAAQGIDGPDDLIVEPDAVYYTASLSGNVDRLDRRTGKHSVVGHVGIGVNPIVRLDDTTILAGIAPGPLPELAPLFNGIFAVDPKGVKRTRVQLRDSASVNAFCLGPDGFLYGPAPTSVVRLDLASREKKILRDGFGYLGAVRFNPTDKLLYILGVLPAANVAAPTLYRMALDGTRFEPFAQLSALPNSAFGADNFAIAQDGTFYVTRFDNPVITRVSPDGKKVEDFTIGKP